MQVIGNLTSSIGAQDQNECNGNYEMVAVTGGSI